MFHQPTARLHQPLLQAGQRPTADPLGQHEPPPQVPQVVGKTITSPVCWPNSEIQITQPDMCRRRAQIDTDEKGKVALSQVAGLKFNSQGALLDNCYQSTQADNKNDNLARFHHGSTFGYF